MVIHRRESPRIEVEAMCWEMIDGREHSGLALDLSSHGLRIERPYAGGPTRREVQLEIEVPGIDEVMWARGDACFDVLVPTTSPAGGPLGLIRRTGYRIAIAAQRDLRMLKEVVFETYRTRYEDMLDRAICSCLPDCQRA
ncbi:MAG: PilZ domain-containing protein [Deltaproteobacteria bacterium]|nr:PilZ domain-containing protein [Deltaproteobacteria bacterium]